MQRAGLPLNLIVSCMTRRALTPGASYAALLLRVTLGFMFLAHLYWKFKILPGGVHTWWSGLLANGYPRFVPWYSISAEFAGALLLIPGIYTRWVSLYTLPVMIGASQFWLIRKGFYFTAAGAELPIAWSIMLILQALLGDGPYAVSWAKMKSSRAS
jgi:putative oxidoreductase